MWIPKNETNQDSIFHANGFVCMLLRLVPTESSRETDRFLCIGEGGSSMGWIVDPGTEAKCPLRQEKLGKSWQPQKKGDVMGGDSVKTNMSFFFRICFVVGEFWPTLPVN